MSVMDLCGISLASKYSLDKIGVLCLLNVLFPHPDICLEFIDPLVTKCVDSWIDFGAQRVEKKIVESCCRFDLGCPGHTYRLSLGRWNSRLLVGDQIGLKGRVGFRYIVDEQGHGLQLEYLV